MTLSYFLSTVSGIRFLLDALGPPVFFLWPLGSGHGADCSLLVLISKEFGGLSPGTNVSYAPVHTGSSCIIFTNVASRKLTGR